jgi:propionyl-CoA carboxylase alpha chain
MNTRLQVEHPVTELVTGLDLVEIQLHLAAGHELPLTQDEVARSGHAVEVRLVAEDPATGWIPSSGRLDRFEPPVVPGVRWDAGVTTGSLVPPYYDSLIAKVIARGVTRDEALDRLRAALRGLRVHGVATNRDALLSIVDDRDVRAGRTTIDLLEERADDLITSTPHGLVARHALAAALALQAERERGRTSAPLAPAGWRSMADAVDTVELDGPAAVSVTLRTSRQGRTLGSVDDASLVAVAAHAWDGEMLDHEIDGIRRSAAVLVGPESDLDDRTVAVFSEGRATTWFVPARLPAGYGAEAARGPSSPVPGTVVAVHVSAGDVVSAGDPLVVLEAMKMEHRITADADASVVEVVVAVGDAVDAHEVLVVLEPVSADEQGASQ